MGIKVRKVIRLGSPIIDPIPSPPLSNLATDLLTLIALVPSNTLNARIGTPLPILSPLKSQNTSIQPKYYHSQTALANIRETLPLIHTDPFQRSAGK